MPMQVGVYATASLDLCMAFDQVNTELLVKRLKIMGFPTDLINLDLIMFKLVKFMIVKMKGPNKPLHQ